MEEVTGNLIGETETLILTGVAGMVFGLAAVQPLAILAFTGPLLLYEEIIFSVSALFCASRDTESLLPSPSLSPLLPQFSQMFNIPYLEWRAIIGLWLMLILVVSALSEITFLVTYFSRFSDEIFTGIIAIFFTYEAVKSIIKVRVGGRCGGGRWEVGGGRWV